MKKTLWFAVAVLLVAGMLMALPALSQQGPPQGGPGFGPPMMGGPGMGGPMMGGPPGGPQATMIVADGVLYVACDGKVIAFEAKTLKKLAEATYWTAPKRPAQGPGGEE